MLRGNAFAPIGAFPVDQRATGPQVADHNEGVSNVSRLGVKVAGQFEFTCASCSKVAATLSLLDGEGPVDAGPLPDGARVSWTPGGPAYRFEFLGVNTGLASVGLADLISGVEELDPSVLAGVDAELAAFCCHTCQLNYCSDCWSTWIEFDEGFYDCTQGRCPQGHEQMLDD